MQMVAAELGDDASTPRAEFQVGAYLGEAAPVPA